jgi:hypothetical protein
VKLFDQLSKNKGTVSSALGKTLAQKVLGQNQIGILRECVELASYEAGAHAFRHIRSGAAKVVELVAEQRPELVAPHLEKLLPALSVPEPQTRWMILRVMGFCARKNPSAAQKAIPYAQKYLDDKEGLCLASSADLFLGDFGAVSKKNAGKVFPILERSMKKPVANELDWLLEACFKLFPNLGNGEQAKVLKFAGRCESAPRKITQQRARNILMFR